MRLDEFITNPPHCVFCGTTTGPFDIEDVFSVWFRKVLPRGTVFQHRNRDDTLGLRPDNVLRLKLEKAICTKCNNGWMSTIEKRVKKLIGGAMVAKEKLALGSTEQDDLAAWAVQKALLIELAASQLVATRPPAYVTHAHLAWLYEHRETRELPPGSSVRLFPNKVPQRNTDRGPRSTAFVHLAVPLVPAEVESPTELDVCGLLSTFTLAFLGVQVFLRDFGDDAVERPTPPVPPLLRSLTTWIGSGVLPTAHWPKSKAFVHGETDFVALGIWDGALFTGYYGYRGFGMPTDPAPEILRPPHTASPGRKM